MATSLELAKRALAEIGTRTTISAIDDSTNEGKYIGLLYNPLRNFLLREGDYDWSMAEATAVVAAAPRFPWLYAYDCPDDYIRLRNLFPAIYDPLLPEPVPYNVVSIGADRFIWTRAAVSLIIYTYPAPEAVWDSIFEESFVRLLASTLAFALENRIEASQVKLQEAISFAGIANLRDA